MISINKAVIFGNLGNDPKVVKSKDKEIIYLSVATNEKYKDKEEWKEKTQWHNVAVFITPLIPILKENLKKV